MPKKLYSNRKRVLGGGIGHTKFRPYVEMMTFTVITDHASLKWLMTLKDLSGRLARWSLQLQSYNFNIEHRKGSDNVVADMLLRGSQEIRAEEIDDSDILSFDTVKFKSEENLEFIKSIQDNAENLPDLKVQDCRIYKRTDFDMVL